MINIPKGTKDALPSDIHKWHFIEAAARRTSEKYGFKEIRTPVFEHTELFSRGVGDTTDVVQKEMYTFLDKGGRSVTLRPEGTAGVARAFIENGLQGGVMPFKTYYLISAFRYERPQAGRLREFHQFGAELYGAEGPSADAEAICFAYRFLREIGVSTAVRLHINSIGCPACRMKYQQALKEYFRPDLADMCEDCRSRFDKNPMRMLDCKEENCKKYTANAPRMLDFLCDDCRAHFEGVKSLLTAAGIVYDVDPSIVRGLDYYSRTVFEFTSDALGAQSTVLGGGRYDTLLSQLGAKPTPAVGFAAGLERLILVLDALDLVPAVRETDCYLLGMDDASRQKAFLLAEEMRSEGLICETDLVGRSVKAQFKYADKLGARFVVVIGETELQEGAAEVKDMQNSASQRVRFGALAQYIKQRRKL